MLKGWDDGDFEPPPVDPKFLESLLKSQAEAKPSEIQDHKLESSAAEPLPDHAPEPEPEIEPEIKPQALPQAAVDLKEIVRTAALDSLFYCKHFFPKTFRQPFAPFHPDLWSLLDDPLARYVNVIIGRGGAKTTKLRAFTSKRIAYGISRTILFVGLSQDKAMQSTGWIRNQVLNNSAWAQTFGLKKGKPFTDEHCVIKHGPEGFDIHLLAYGVTGSIRGVNLDDWRPDLIVGDDLMNEENQTTPAQRKKIRDLVMGALKYSLSPATESPDAKMVLLNTPQDFEDLCQMALKDRSFRSAVFGCWTKETEDLPVEFQESSWEARYPTPMLREQKQISIENNEYSLFAREMECKLVTPETANFRGEWIKYFGEGEAFSEPPVEEMWIEYVIDPVPPPSEKQIEKGLKGKDFEAHSILGRWKNRYYVLETQYNRGHDPGWTGTTFFELCGRWNPRKVIVEAVAYQRTLIWLLKEAMKKTGRYYVIEPFVDKRKKDFRIVQGLKGPLTNGELYLRRSQTALISQIIHYPGKNPMGTHDDVIETVAIGLTSLSRGYVGEVSDDHYRAAEKHIPDLENWRGAP
jgi:hypothetical protein